MARGTDLSIRVKIFIIQNDCLTGTMMVERVEAAVNWLEPTRRYNRRIYWARRRGDRRRNLRRVSRYHRRLGCIVRLELVRRYLKDGCSGRRRAWPRPIERVR